MARARLVAKALSTSQRYAELHRAAGPLAEFCQSLYPLLIVHADDFGRQAGDPFTIKHGVCPTSPRSLADVTQALQALHEVGLVAWYEINGRKYLQIVEFDRHQQGLHKRTRSEFPDVSGNFQEIPGNSQNIPETPGITRNPPEILGEEKRTEGNRTEEKKNVSSELEQPSSSEPTPAVLTFPTIGMNGSVWALRHEQVQDWHAAYPQLDIEAECRKALAWVMADPAGRRKTARGMPRFLVRWLNNAADRPAGSVPAATGGPRLPAWAQAAKNAKAGL